MSGMGFGLIELIFVFGVALAFGFWELWSLRKVRKKRQNKPASDES